MAIREHDILKATEMSKLGAATPGTAIVVRILTIRPCVMDRISNCNICIEHVRNQLMIEEPEQLT